MGEAVVPVTRERAILGPSLLNFDVRGEEYLDEFGRVLDADTLYPINGNTLGNHYSLTKLMWIKQHQPDLVDRADWFLHWSGFIAFMLGADPAVDYSLANRTLLFDVDRGVWSPDLLRAPGWIWTSCRARPVWHADRHGRAAVAAELGLSADTVIVAGCARPDAPTRSAAA